MSGVELRSSVVPLCRFAADCRWRPAARDLRCDRHEKGATLIHWHHIAICVGLVAVAIVLIAAGAGGFAFLAPLGCVVMMGMMIWMMVRPGGHGGGH